MSTEQHAPITRTAFFRFYEELNDFLIEEQRKETFPYEFTGNPSIKDTIEAIGVPHTEIDLILVAGESVGFDYHMYGGEYVSVYPVFESLDITPPVHFQRFFCTVNVNNKNEIVEGWCKSLKTEWKRDEAWNYA